MAEIIIPVPSDGDTNEELETMPTPHAEAWEGRQQLAMDSAQGQRDSAYLYAQDSRYAYQRRLDEFSIKEGLGTQIGQTSQIARDAVQGKTMQTMPPVFVNTGKE